MAHYDVPEPRQLDVVVGGEVHSQGLRTRTEARITEGQGGSAATSTQYRTPPGSNSMHDRILATLDQVPVKHPDMALLRQVSKGAELIADRGNRVSRHLPERIPRGPQGPANEGSRRLLEAAAKGPRLDKRLWTGLAALTGAKENSTSLVGTPDQVADAILDYYDLGVSSFLIRGFDPIADAVQYGGELLPRVRKLVAARTTRHAA